MTNPEMPTVEQLKKLGHKLQVHKTRTGTHWRTDEVMDEATDVLEVIAAHLSTQDKVMEGDKECYRCKGKGTITVGDGYSIDACPICNPAKNETTMKYSDEQIEEIIEWLDAKYARHSEDEDKTGAVMLRSWLAERQEVSKHKEIGIASYMPATDGFTMACFKASDVPEGTKIYIYPVPKLLNEANVIITALRNRLTSEITEKYGHKFPYEEARTMAESDVNEFEDAFNEAMRNRP